jgi:hypothetical protein
MLGNLSFFKEAPTCGGGASLFAGLSVFLKKLAKP